MKVKKPVYIFLLCLSFILMFMNFMITGLALFFLSGFIFEPGKMKPNEKWQQFYQGKTMKKIRKVITLMMLLSMVVLAFTHPKLNLIIPIFFIAMMISPYKSKHQTTDYDFDDF
jgi:predicted RND superfamily exporter protein